MPPPAGSPTTPPASTETPTLTRTVLMTGLTSPWDIAFTPDGTMLFTEKCSGLSARFANGTMVRLFGTTGSALVAPDLFCQGQSGVHGVAVDPDFGNGNRYVYVFMASNLTHDPRTNRVVRLTLNADTMSAGNRTDIITDIAYKDVGQCRRRSGLAQRWTHTVRPRPDICTSPPATTTTQRCRRTRCASEARCCASIATAPRRRATTHRRRLRSTHLHVRSPQRSGHHVPAGRPAERRPAVHRRARAQS